VRVAGIDGTKGGWVAVVLDSGTFAGDRLIQPIESSFEELRDVEILAIDVPIGFGPREADAAARAFLSGAASTVFSTASREVLERPFGPGLGLSAQSHALGPRIIHLTQLANTDDRIFEVHPEVSFRVMNDGRPLRHRKKSAGGALERLELLRKHGIELTGVGESARAPLDDALDAAAAAWTANRIGLGEAASLPDPPEVAGGREVAIWF
jgi:predicted RNase H-like nuclease